MSERLKKPPEPKTNGDRFGLIDIDDPSPREPISPVEQERRGRLVGPVPSR